MSRENDDMRAKRNAALCFSPTLISLTTRALAPRRLAHSMIFQAQPDRSLRHEQGTVSSRKEFLMKQFTMLHHEGLLSGPDSSQCRDYVRTLDRSRCSLGTSDVQILDI